MVDYKVFEWEYRERCREYITPERIADAALALSRSHSPDPKAITEHVLAKDIIVDLCSMHYGMQEKNPLDFINFYSKHNPDSELPAAESKLDVFG
jgi:deoxynucleoside triphosphate triphosphohydrolase SAMHD1